LINAAAHVEVGKARGDVKRVEKGLKCFRQTMGLFKTQWEKMNKKQREENVELLQRISRKNKVAQKLRSLMDLVLAEDRDKKAFEELRAKLEKLGKLQIIQKVPRNQRTNFEHITSQVEAVIKTEVGLKKHKRQGKTWLNLEVP